jgi:hypothetical protein
MVMYLSPLILTPLEMTALGSLLSLNEAAMALISAAVSWRCQQDILSHVPQGPSSDLNRSRIVCCAREVCLTYGEVWGRGPRGLAVDIADEGLVDVAGADEAAARAVRRAELCVYELHVPLVDVCWQYG